MNKRAGELSAQELENLMFIVANPRQFKIPDWFLNRKKDYKDGRYSQVVSNALDMKLRDDLERLKKIRYNFCLHLWIYYFNNHTFWRFIIVYLDIQIIYIWCCAIILRFLLSFWVFYGLFFNLGYSKHSNQLHFSLLHVNRLLMYMIEFFANLLDICLPLYQFKAFKPFEFDVILLHCLFFTFFIGIRISWTYWNCDKFNDACVDTCLWCGRNAI